MKTIREPLVPPDPEKYHLPCRNIACRAILECTEDELKREWLVSQQEALYKMLCPHCAYESFFTTQDLDRYLHTEK